MPRSRDRAPQDPRSSAQRGTGACLLAVAAIAAIAAACERSEPSSRTVAGSQGGSDRPAITGALVAITAELAGASAETVERDVIVPIEAAVEPRPGVRSVRSTSRDGRGVVLVELARGREFNAALPALQTAVNGIRSILPAELTPPTIVPGDPDAAPALWFAASGPIAALQLSELVHDAVVPRLERVAAVQGIDVRGDTARGVIIRLDPTRLDALGITLDEVHTALGRITGRRGGAPGDLAMLGAVELARRSGAAIRLGDVAAIEDGIASRPDPTGGPVMLGVRLQPGVDPGPVLAALRTTAAEIAAALPARCTLAEAAAPASAPVASMQRRFALEVAVRGPDWATLERLADQLERDLRARAALVAAVASDHRSGTAVQIITPDLDRAAGLGVTPSDIATAVRGLTIGPGKLRVGARDVPIILRIGAQDLALADAVAVVRVRATRGELIPLSAIASVTTRPSVVVTRRDRERAITLSVQPVASPLRDVVRREISALTRALPAGYRATITPPP